VQPTFDASGPPVDQDPLNNVVVLSPTSFRILVAPRATGILKISINGTRDSIDLAGNNNDFYRNPNSRIGAVRYVLFSAGPPLPGSISFQYERPRLDQEYPPVVQAFGFQTPAPPSLTVSWSGFTTAVLYDAWIEWGSNLSTPEVNSLNATQYTFGEFSALLGAEYQVYIRAFNAFNESVTTSRTFLFPKFHMIADASSKEVVALPDMLSPGQSHVSSNVLVAKDSFLSLNPWKVLTFRSVNKSAGDQDACRLNSPTVMCTDMNFHMEVPASQFVVFRKPITLQFLFGRKGWPDLYFRPRLRYWEAHEDTWRDVAATCPPDQVFDRWNELHRIYEISVCHLSQFAVFQEFEPVAPTTAAPPSPRPESYGGATFWLILGGSAILGVLVCCVCYFAFAKKDNGRRTSAYKDLGIKPVSERLPSRRPLGHRAEALSLQDREDLEQEQGLLALPAPEVALALSDGLASPQALPAIEYMERREIQFTPEASEHEIPKSYEVLMPAIGWAKSRSYLRDLWTMKAMPGGLLLKEMGGVDFRRVDYVELAQRLFSIKLPGVPRIFAQNAMCGDGSDFTLRELSLLGDISVAVPVNVFDNGALVNPKIHDEPFEATLLYTCGALLMPDEASADWKELVTQELTINRQAYYNLYERRLLPCFQYANDHAGVSSRRALITIPALGCGQFAGRFQGTLGEMLGDVLQQILETHGGKWPHIEVVYFDASNEGRARREIIKGTAINYIVQPNDQIGRHQLCPPRDFEGVLGGVGDDFSTCDLFSFVSWDRVSWPGNHYWGGNRETDDGIKAAASDAMYKLSGVEGKYDVARKQYMPPDQFKTWSDVLKKNNIKLDVSSLKDSNYDPDGICDESFADSRRPSKQVPEPQPVETSVSSAVDVTMLEQMDYTQAAVAETVLISDLSEPELLKAKTTDLLTGADLLTQQESTEVAIVENALISDISEPQLLKPKTTDLLTNAQLENAQAAVDEIVLTTNVSEPELLKVKTTDLLTGADLVTPQRNTQGAVAETVLISDVSEPELLKVKTSDLLTGADLITQQENAQVTVVEDLLISDVSEPDLLKVKTSDLLTGADLLTQQDSAEAVIVETAVISDAPEPQLLKPKPVDFLSDAQQDSTEAAVDEIVLTSDLPVQEENTQIAMAETNPATNVTEDDQRQADEPEVVAEPAAASESARLYTSGGASLSGSARLLANQEESQDRIFSVSPRQSLITGQQPETVTSQQTETIDMGAMEQQRQVSKPQVSRPTSAPQATKSPRLPPAPTQILQATVKPEPLLPEAQVEPGITDLSDLGTYSSADGTTENRENSTRPENSSELMEEVSLPWQVQGSLDSV